MNLAIYFHEETCETTLKKEKIRFIGQSLPYFNEVRKEIQKHLNIKELPLNRMAIDEFKKVHTNEYVETIKALNRGEEVVPLKISMECANLFYALPGYEYGLGGLYTAIDKMKTGNLEGAYCFCLPSHHGFPDKGHGYCLLNSQAVAVRYAQEKGFHNILIVDWDIHHGDGTQTIFENDNSVYCINIHSAADLYMSKMKTIQLGTTSYGEKVGHCNIPVLYEMLSKEFYHKRLKLTGKVYRANEIKAQFSKVLNNLPFIPDLIMIFDGHDSHSLDCGEGITNFSYDDFRTLTKMVKAIGQKHQCPILSMPGGGYKLAVTVNSAVAHLEVLSSK